MKNLRLIAAILETNNIKIIDTYYGVHYTIKSGLVENFHEDVVAHLKTAYNLTDENIIGVSHFKDGDKKAYILNKFNKKGEK